MAKRYAVRQGEHAVIHNPGATTYPIHTMQDTPISGCCTMLNVFQDAQYPQHWGVHDDNEGFYVVSGFGRYYIDDVEYELSPGTSMLAPAGKPHGIKKTGEADLQVFIFHFPRQQEEIA